MNGINLHFYILSVIGRFIQVRLFHSYSIETPNSILELSCETYANGFLNLFDDRADTVLFFL